ncbi:hypothetical protein AMAG_15711 [Allomyces macrogynus ATCC 38327]|uniref:2,4-dienoyl-CoA reductase [(3E)-enoyl-CoA-producing] n=1 Tax=Allomyces macrogynus (strain ATCC 38327) TaxID=578462 RepID=A0A0L0T9U8_ALLM3|nr:hypothetical protein AMAG_15711 [Allomyces macrogynus ATCC 38327]|eukprot:KNE71491.1 hypothetical protein AMAG_15711 [Allomyces macrogynus ATCC 38327]
MSSPKSTPTTDIFRKDLFVGKVAFVTGGGSGICKGMTEALMRHGCDAVIVSRTQSKLDEAAKELEAATGRTCYAVAGDVRKPEDMINAVQKAMDKFGRIDILVCGAAGNFLSPVEHLSYRAFKTVVEIDLLGTFNTIKACLEPLKASGNGVVINVTAALQYSGSPLQVHAVSAKSGVDGMTKYVLLHGPWPWKLGRYGIRVNGIAPGPIEGPRGWPYALLLLSLRLMPPGMEDGFLDTIALRRMGQVRDIEHATLYLASDAGAYVTGTVLVVDGGSWFAQNGPLGMGLNLFLAKGKGNKL